MTCIVEVSTSRVPSVSEGILGVAYIVDALSTAFCRITDAQGGEREIVYFGINQIVLEIASTPLYFEVGSIYFKTNQNRRTLVAAWQGGRDHRTFCFGTLAAVVTSPRTVGRVVVFVHGDFLPRRFATVALLKKSRGRRVGFTTVLSSPRTPP